jgi:hypothetical protein
MKPFHFIIAFLCVCLYACKTAQPVANPEEQGFFKQVNPDIRNNAAYYGHLTRENRRSEHALLYQDIIDWKLPLDEAKAKEAYPGWRDYDAFSRRLLPQLQPITQQFVSKNFLLYYPLHKGAYNTETANAVTHHLQVLITRRYRDFWLLYDYLAWLKKNRDGYFTEAKSKVLEYALIPPASSPPPPRQTPPKPTAAATEFFQKNPVARAQITQMTSLIEENKRYLERIKLL